MATDLFEQHEIAFMSLSELPQDNITDTRKHNKKNLETAYYQLNTDLNSN